MDRPKQYWRKKARYCARTKQNGFRIVEILKRSFTKNINTCKLELKNKLNYLKYNPYVYINIYC